MDSKKSIIKLMDDFSKKISSSNEAQNISLKTSHSSIQQKINDRESQISIITAVNTQNLIFLAFTSVMNFQIRNFVRLQKVVCKNAEGKFYVLNVIHVMRHIYMAGTNLLLKDKLAF